MDQMTLFETGEAVETAQSVPSPALAGSAARGNTVGTAKKSEARTAADDSGRPYLGEGAPEEPPVGADFWVRYRWRKREGARIHAEYVASVEAGEDVEAVRGRAERDFHAAAHRQRRAFYEYGDGHVAELAEYERWKAQVYATRSFNRMYPADQS